MYLGRTERVHVPREDGKGYMYLGRTDTGTCTSGGQKGTCTFLGRISGLQIVHSRFAIELTAQHVLNINSAFTCKGLPYDSPLRMKIHLFISDRPSFAGDYNA